MSDFWLQHTVRQVPMHRKNNSFDKFTNPETHDVEMEMGAYTELLGV